MDSGTNRNSLFVTCETVKCIVYVHIFKSCVPDYIYYKFICNFNFVIILVVISIYLFSLITNTYLGTSHFVKLYC